MILIERGDCRPLSLRHAADLLQALGHPIRLQILHALRSGPHTVSEIVAQLALAQPVVSRHLAILREHGVVRCRAQGRQRRYQLAACRIEPLLEVLFDDAAPTDGPLDQSPKDQNNKGKAA